MKIAFRAKCYTQIWTVGGSRNSGMEKEAASKADSLVNEGAGYWAKGPYFLTFGEHQSMPPEPERVRKAGYRKWGKAALEVSGVLCWRPTPREAGGCVTYVW